jgi:ABC-type lipoprotein export system ATPase subunit
MLTVNNLVFSYNEDNKFQFPNLNCEKGEHWLILGKSGCGKTTFLHLLGGLLKAKAGEILLNQTNICTLSESALDKFRGKNIGIVFQKAHLIKALTVEENLLTAQYLAGSVQDKSKINNILKRLNLENKADSYPSNLSQGEQQRVSIARALVNEPAIILADEPTSSLDDENAEEVLKLLLDISESFGSTLIIVTHDARLKSKFENKIELSKVV